LKLHDHTRQSGHPSAQRTSNGFTREAQKKVFWFFSTEKNDLPYSRSFSGAPSGLRMVGNQERLLFHWMLGPPERSVTATEKSLLVVFFRKQRLPSLRALYARALSQSRQPAHQPRPLPNFDAK
jgi:hypothetical protein